MAKQKAEIQKNNVAFIDLDAQKALISSEINSAIARVLQHGKYILGPEVTELEAALSNYTGVSNVVGCSSGTDALLMILMALEVKVGDAIIVPSFTFPATPEVAALLGATPVFADVDKDTFNITVEEIEKAVAVAKNEGLTPRAVIVVDLFGQPAEYEEIQSVCNKHDIDIICDAAQSLGAEYKGKKIGSFGCATATSFFPAKPLGCYGDGGAVFTQDEKLAKKLKSIRVHGKGTDKYDNVIVGLNARLDTMQAAILLEKLKIFPEEVASRQKVADYYSRNLNTAVKTPKVIDTAKSVWAQYTITVEKQQRGSIKEFLAEENIPTAIYYPKPLHQQEAYKGFPKTDCTTSEKLSQTVLSIPMHPYLDTDTQDIIIDAIKRT